MSSFKSLEWINNRKMQIEQKGEPLTHEEECELLALSKKIKDIMDDASKPQRWGRPPRRIKK